MSYVDYAIIYLVFVFAAVCAAYAVVRAGSVGYFRTKYEHFRRVQRDIGGQDGEEE